MGGLAVAPALGRALPLWDLGELCFFAERLLAGAVPGRDFAVNAYGPGQPLALAMIWAIFGQAFVGIWALFLAEWVALFVLLRRLSRRLVPGRLGWLPLLCLVAAPGPAHKGFLGLALVVAMTALLALREGGSSLRWGLVLAAVGLFRVDVGAAGVLGGGAVLVLCGAGPRALLAWLAGPLGLTTLGVAILTLRDPGAPLIVVRQVLAEVATNERIPWPTMPGLPDLLSPLSADPFLLWAPAIVAPLLIVHAARTKDGAAAIVGATVLLAANQVRIKPDLAHLLQIGPALWLALAMLLSATRPGVRSASISLLLVPGVLLAQTTLFHRGDPYVGGLTIPWERDRPLQTALGRAWVNSGEWEALQPALRALELRVPPGPLWTPVYDPLFLALSGRAPASPVAGLLYVADDRAAQEQVIAAVRDTRPAAAVLRDTSPEGPTRRLDTAGPLLKQELDEQWRVVGQWGGTVLLVPRQ